MSDPDPLIDRPAWTPRWLSVDDARGMRWLRRVLIAVFAAGLAACVTEGANGPADPEVGGEPTVSTSSTTADDRSTTSQPSGSTESTAPGESSAPAGSDSSTTSGGPTPGGGPGESSVPTTSGEGSTTTEASGPSALAARFGTIVVDLVTASGEILELCLLDAQERAERSQGLKEVTDLEGHDGMLFRWERPVEGNFVMIDTVTPLTISWWEGDGDFVSSTDMEPCTDADDADCRRYGAGGPYQYAVEVFQGDIPEAAAGARLEPRIGSSCQVS